MQKARTFTEGSIFKALIALSIPVVFSNILQSAYQLIDTIWVGRLGSDAVAAVSLSFPIIFLMFAIGGGLTIAGSILVAQFIGGKQIDKANHVSAQTLLMILITVLPLTVVGVLVSETLMKFMGADQAVLPLATSYLQISFVGLIFVFGFFAFQALLRGVGDVKTPIYIVLGTVLLNAILDPLLIFGYGPVPGFGVTGAAIATIVTQGVATAIGLLILFSGKYGIHLKLHEFRPDQKLMIRMTQLGLPASIEQSMRAFGMIVMTILVSGFGTSIIASYGIGIRVLSFVIIPAFGLSMATSTVVAQNIGAGKIHRAEKTAYMSSLLAFGSLTLIGVFIFLFAKQIASAFIVGDPVALEESILFVQIMAFSLGFLGIQLSLGGALQGAGDTMTSMILTVISTWVLQFPIAYMLSSRFGFSELGIWLAFPITNVIMAVVSVLWFMRGTWKKPVSQGDHELEEEIRKEAIIEEGITT